MKIKEKKIGENKAWNLMKILNEKKLKAEQ